jgi:hypothetical protein
MDGMKLSPRGQFTWSGVFFSSLLFCSWAFFLVPPSLNPIFFLGTPTYFSNLPTSPYLPHHPFALLYPKLQNHIELDRKLVEVVESLWSLGHETSSRALTLKVSDMV